ncbi:BA75_04073T0 [Komagataella pastoris]|uniref:BA75_04073T0 n=1 Tax=Komagataella pastoris TaxID=4922 RepID=A0A1B2JFB1_PICPA|nr:BA75_04073T0 [Komagataella pastoris]
MKQSAEKQGIDRVLGSKETCYLLHDGGDSYLELLLSVPLPIPSRAIVPFWRGVVKKKASRSYCRIRPSSSNHKNFFYALRVLVRQALPLTLSEIFWCRGVSELSEFFFSLSIVGLKGGAESIVVCN